MANNASKTTKQAHRSNPSISDRDSVRWHVAGRTAVYRSRMELESATRRLSLWRRLDSLWVALVVMILALVTLFWTVLIEVAKYNGIFTPPLVRRIMDERILTHMDRFGFHPFLYATWHPPDGQFYISRENGTLHRYHPATRLWTEEIIPSGHAIQPIIQLGSGCPMHGNTPSGINCPDTESLWAITRGGGLLQRTGHQWRVLVGDSRFTGTDGHPISHEQIVSAAVSSHRLWLAVVTRSNGVGLYHIPTRTWSEVTGNAPGNLSHVVWWQDRFWAGGANGLVSIIPDTTPPYYVPYTRISGEILDLDADVAGSLYILMNRPCMDGNNLCRWLGRLDTATGQPVVLMDIRNRYPNLDLNNLNFAHEQDHRLYLAGQAGLYQYDLDTHSWDRILSSPVTAGVSMPSGNGFWFGYLGGVGFLSGNSPILQQLPGSRIVTLVPVGQDKALALCASNSVYSLSSNGHPKEVFNGAIPGPDNREFTSAVAIQDDVLFIGPSGALIHNVRTRTYEDIAPFSLPYWLKGPGIRLYRSGPYIYALWQWPKTPATTIYPLAWIDVRRHQFRPVVPEQTIRAGIHRVVPLADQGLGIIDKHENAYQFSPMGYRINGTASPEMQRLEWLDVAGIGSDLVVATRSGIHVYQGRYRTWSDLIAMPDNDIPQQLAVSNDRLYIRTRNKRLIRLDTSPTPVIGGGTGFRITDNTLQDVRINGDWLYLAGGGWVEAYDMEKRRIVGRWKIACHSKNPMALKGIIDGSPLTLCGHTAWIGDIPIEPEAGNVENLFWDGRRIRTVRVKSSRRYLKAYTLASNNTPVPDGCWFANPSTPPGIRNIHDVAPLPQNRVAVATNGGLFIYDPARGSWYPCRFSQPFLPDRIYGLKDVLIMTGPAESGKMVAIVKTDDISVSDACGSGSVYVQAQFVRASTVAVDADRNRVAWIGPSQEVVLWDGAAIRQLLPSPESGPDVGSIRRVFDRQHLYPAHILFTTDRAIFRYDLTTHRWQRIALKFHPKISANTDLDIAIEQAPDQEIVTVSLANGVLYTGTFSQMNTSVTLNRFYTPVAHQALACSGNQLLDVQDNDDGLWTFVCDDRMAYYDPVSRKWVGEAIFPTKIPDAQYLMAGSRGIRVEDRGRVWQVARHPGPGPVDFVTYAASASTTTVIDSEGTLWRIGPDGRLEWSRMPETGSYPPFQPYGPKLFSMDPAKINGAWQEDDQVIFSTETGTLAWNRRTGKVVTGIVPPKTNGEALWARIKSHFQRLPNGQWVYDPFTQFITDATGGLFARRPSGLVAIADHGTIQPVRPPALDTGWLQWDRNGHRFRVQTDSGIREMAPSQFIQNHRLPFEGVAAVLRTDTDQFYVANDHGIWRYTRMDLSLTDPAIVFYPNPMTRPITAVHGRFITANGDVAVGRPDPHIQGRSYRVTLENVRIEEDMDTRTASCTIRYPNRTKTGWIRQGFLWDQQRRGIGFDGDQIWIQTDAGIHPVNSWDGFDLGPMEKASYLGQLCHEPTSGILFQLDHQWYRRGSLPGQWILLDHSPETNRQWIDNDRWQWKLENGQVRVRMPGAPAEFGMFMASQSGIGFFSDQLVGASLANGQLMVLTKAYLEILDPEGQLGAPGNRRFPPISLDHLETVTFADGHEASMGRQGSRVLRWNPDTHRFSVVTGLDNPYRNRRLVETSRIRFTRFGQQVLKEMAATGPNGNFRWIPFQFTHHRFPFDVVTQVDATSNHLAVGTNAGLQIYSQSRSMGLDDIQAVYVPGETGSMTITQLAQVSGNIRACTGNACIQWQPPDTIQAVASIPKTPRIKAKTNLWEWTVHPDGTITGHYRNADGNLHSEPIRMVRGRFPHDRFQDMAVWNHQAVVLWKSGWLTFHEGTSMGMDSRFRNYPIPDKDPDRLVVLDKDIHDTTITLPAGLYVLAASGNGYRFTNQSWQPVSQPLATALIRYHESPPVIAYAHLRLRPPEKGNPWQFEYRSPSGTWHPIPWTQGRLALDHWRDMSWVDPDLWAATGLGLVRFSRNAKARIELDPDHPFRIAGPGSDKDGLEITDLTAQQRTLIVRCNHDSDQVFQVHVDAIPDHGTFEKIPKSQDPFITQVMVPDSGDGGWEWKRTGRVAGDPGHLEGKLAGQNIHLTQGQFSFDTINSLSLAQPGWIHLGTDNGGWIQAPIGPNLPINKMIFPSRPDLNPTTVVAVGTTIDQGQPLLYLKTAAGDAIKVQSDNRLDRVTHCQEFLGYDGFWEYLKDNDQVRIVARSGSGGEVFRHLANGRFTDDLVTGIPVAVPTSQGFHYYRPVAAGVIQMNAHMQPTAILGPPFPGLPASSSPTAIGVIPEIGPVYAGYDGIYQLNGSRNRLSDFQYQIPSQASITAMEWTAPNWVTVYWRQAQNRHWTLIQKGNPGVAVDTIYVDFSRFPTYIRHRHQRPGIAPWMEIRYREPAITIASAGGEPVRTIQLPSQFHLIRWFIKDDKLLLVGIRQILEMDLDQLVETMIFRQ